MDEIAELTVPRVENLDEARMAIVELIDTINRLVRRVNELGAST